MFSTTNSTGGISGSIFGTISGSDFGTISGSDFGTSLDDDLHPESAVKKEADRCHLFKPWTKIKKNGTTKDEGERRTRRPAGTPR